MHRNLLTFKIQIAILSLSLSNLFRKFMPTEDVTLLFEISKPIFSKLEHSFEEGKSFLRVDKPLYLSPIRTFLLSKTKLLC